MSKYIGYFLLLLALGAIPPLLTGPRQHAGKNPGTKIRIAHSYYDTGMSIIRKMGG